MNEGFDFEGTSKLFLKLPKQKQKVKYYPIKFLYFSILKECENEFIACVENLNGDNPTALERTENFASCIDPDIFSGLPGCTEECAPTLAMMSTSETPTYAPNSNWGTGSDTAEDRPDTSLCEIEEGLYF